MKKVIENEHWLRVLEKANPKLRSAMLSYANDKEITAVCEIIYNIFNNNIHLSPKQKKYLSKYKTKLRQIYKHCCGEKKLGKQKLHKSVVQVGGALPFILAALAPLIAKAALGGAVGAATGIATKKILGY